MQLIHDYYIAPGVVVTGDVVLSAGVNLWYGTIIRGDISRITLHERVNLQDGCIVHSDHDLPQTIEEGVVAGHAAILHGVRIGRDSLIGIGARILSGADIGAECLIAAGTVVTEDKKIPTRSVVMGVPGKIVREITAAEIERTRRINAHYLELAGRYARGEFPSPLAHKK